MSFQPHPHSLEELVAPENRNPLRRGVVVLVAPLLVYVLLRPYVTPDAVLANGSSLPLKLHEAAITFGIGIVLMAGVLVSRPLPVARLLRVVDAPNGLDRTLSLMIGVFLILHALAHLALALTLPTSTYMVASRVVNWGTLAIAAIGLSANLRRSRKPA